MLLALVSMMPIHQQQLDPVLSNTQQSTRKGQISKIVKSTNKIKGTKPKSMLAAMTTII